MISQYINGVNTKMEDKLSLGKINKKDSFGSKELTRICALEILYAIHFNSYSTQENIKDYMEKELWKSNFDDCGNETYVAEIEDEMLQYLVQGTMDDLEIIKSYINKIVNNITKFNYAPLLLQLIVFMATFELKSKKIDYKIIISQYVSLTSLYFDHVQISFVNALLDSISKYLATNDELKNG